MKNLLTAFLLTLVVCLTTSAQTMPITPGDLSFRIDTGANVSIAYHLGYKNPDAGVYVNALVRKNRFGAQGDFNYVPLARKIVPGDGHTFSSSATGRFYLDQLKFWNDNPANYETSKFYLAGGGRWIRQYTSTFNGAVFRPAAGLGYDFSRTATVQAFYEFRDRSEHRASAIAIEGEKLLSVESGVVSYLVFRPQVAFVRFEQDGKTRYGFRTGAQIGIGFAK